MKLLKSKTHKKSIIERTAAHFRQSPEDVRKEINHAIELAWKSDDPQVKAFHQLYFPAGKPTPEEFIEVISNKIKPHPSSPTK